MIPPPIVSMLLLARFHLGMGAMPPNDEYGGLRP